MPAGFKEVDLISRRVNGLNLLDYQLIFSDGLAYVSLFIRPITRGTEPKEGSVAIGSTNISAKIPRWVPDYVGRHGATRNS